MRLRAAGFFASVTDIPVVDVLTGFLSAHKQVFDGTPSFTPEPDKPSQSLPPEIPRITLNSSISGKWVFQIAKSRADVVRTISGPEDFLSVSILHEECAPILESFVHMFNIEMVRMGSISEWLSMQEKPGQNLARFFCRDAWIGPGGELNDPENFELHAHKVFNMAGRFQANCWLRFKTGHASGIIEGPSIIFEHDINTVAQAGRVFSAQECREFYQAASKEFERTIPEFCSERKADVSECGS